MAVTRNPYLPNTELNKHGVKSLQITSVQECFSHHRQTMTGTRM